MSRRVLVAVGIAVVAAAALWAAVRSQRGEPDEGRAPSAARGDAEPEAAAARPRPRATVADEEHPPATETKEAVATEFLVFGEDGQPVPGAALATESDPVAEARTGDDGRARLAVPPDAGVRVGAPGLATVDVRRHELDRHDGENGPLVVRLRETREVAGQVVDSAGAPLAGATVLWTAAPKAEFVTGPDGRFAFAGLSSEPHWGATVEARLEGRVPAHLAVKPGERDVRVVLPRAAMVSGVVVHEDGSPAAGARFALGARDADAAGRFETRELPPGTVHLVAFAPAPADPAVEFRGHVAVDLTEGESVAGVRVVVRPNALASYVRVRVLGADGTPASGAEVALWDGDEELASEFTDDAGVATIRTAAGVTSGTSVHLTASHPDGDTEARTEPPIPTASRPPLPVVELRLGPPSRLRLRLLTPDGAEIPLARATIGDGIPPPLDADGAFALTVDGAWSAKIRVPGFATRGLSFEPPHPRLRSHDVRLVPAADVRGRIRTHDGRTPLGRPWVSVVVTEADGEREVESCDLDADGRFVVASLPPGRAELKVKVSGRSAPLQTFRFALPAGSLDLGDLVLDTPTLVHGVVRDEQGRPVAGAEIRAETSVDSEIDETTTRSDGTFDFRLRRALPTRLRVVRRGLGTEFVEDLWSAPGPLEIVVRRGGDVRLTRRPRDRPFARLPGGASEWLPDWSFPSQAYDGRVVFVQHDLPPGRVEFVVRRDGRECVTPVDVVPGETVDCVLAE